MISKTVEYALRAIVSLAQNQGNPLTVQKISELTKVPRPYLAKLMQVLVRGKLVRSQRGLHGGFCLTKQPDEMTIWEVVDTVDPLERIRECPLGLSYHGKNLCPLHRRLDDAMAQMEEGFRNTSVSELLVEANETPLCASEDLKRGLNSPPKKRNKNRVSSSKA